MRGHRDVNWVLQKFRHILMGREWNKSQLRFKENMSSRSPPHPMIPDGPAHLLSNNSYVSRDRRRLVTAPKEYVNVLLDGKQIEAKVGQTLMSAILASGTYIEAACDGNCACSTCHVYISEDHFAKLPSASEEEEDMLDLALFVQPTSRLSCQIIIDHSQEGMGFRLPSATRNFYAGKDKTTNTPDDNIKSTS